MTAFQELFAAPTGRHVFSLALAAFIDIIVFLLAYASGPYFFGNTEERWFAAAASLEGLDAQVFARDFLRKFSAGPRGMARVEATALSAGEQQLCLLLNAKGMAATREEDGHLYYVLDERIHEQLLESLANQNLRFRLAVS